MSTVRTQAEFDQALAALGDRWGIIEIRSERGVWIYVSNTRNATVEASGSATVRASGSATVRAFDSATVEASGSATVEAFDSATVRAFDSATVEASGSATVRASGSATVHGKGSAKITASPYVAVHLHSTFVEVSGGVVIDVTKTSSSAEVWAEYHGAKIENGVVTVFKAVNDQWTTTRGFDYRPGATPSAPDWQDNNRIGGGLHFSPSPVQARYYFPEATKFVAVGVALADLRPIADSTVAKAKAPRAVVYGEVDVDGNPVA